MLANDFTDVIAVNPQLNDHRVLALDGSDLNFIGFFYNRFGDLLDKFLHRFSLAEGSATGQ